MASSKRPMFTAESSESPPPSPRKRRMWLRESDEADGDMSIEDYLYACDGYRKTTALPRYPLPLIVRDLPPHLQGNRLAAIWGPLEQILSSFGIQEGHYFASIVCLEKFGYLPMSKIPTLRVEIKSDKTQKWSEIRNVLKKCLSDNAFPEVQVEIIHPDKCFLPSLFTIPSSHPSISIYNSIRDQLVELVDQRLRTAWLSMCIYKIGRTESVATFAVVVHVTPFAHCNWNLLKVDLEQMIRPRAPRGQIIGVEFLPALLTSANTSSEIITMFGRLLPNISRTPKMGMSVGVEGRASSGTLACFVDLTVGQKVHHGVLTNYHIIEPLENAPAQVKKQAALYGTGYFTSSDGTATKAIFPSEEDSKELQTIAATNVTQVQKEVTDARELKEMKEVMGDNTTAASNMLAHTQRVLKELQELKSITDTMPITLGKVLLSSGKLIGNNNMFIDWAFVELKRDAGNDWVGNKNILPERNSAVPPPSAYGVQSTYLYSHENPRPQGFSKMIPNSWYLKTGRSSRITTGICHGTEVFTNCAGQELSRYNTKGERIQTRNHITKAWIVIGKAGSGDPAQGDFCSPGDSGSAIIDNKTFIAGLLFGELTGLCGNKHNQVVGAGLVCCMDQVVADIENAATHRDRSGRVDGAPAKLTLT
ncbi:MAG: hypothetical protein M1834_003658 [Cirrosporium novae-zelandiae]|nr:MAG: hypothetical protein M1834_003658 [Cirrosporium novae-zelandiae]